MTESHEYSPPIEAMGEDDKNDPAHETEVYDAPPDEKVSREKYLKKLNEDFPGRFGLDGQLYETGD